ncbi:MAG: hypothetical protein RI883_1350 [Bacteroidota bacterium]|jgi:hypothetical protein
MRARYLLIALGIISLFWIGFVAVDLIDKKDAYSPSLLFGKEDHQLLIINRKKEVDLNIIPFKTNPKNHEIINTLLPFITDEKSIYISAERKHFLIESKFHWTKNKVKELLRKGNLKFELKGLKSITITNYKIDFNKNFLYFHESDFITTIQDEWFTFDRKSSAVLIDFNSDKPSLQEIYFKGENTVEFHSKNDKKIKGNQVIDKELFASVLPKNITDYHFKENEYAKSTDSIYRFNIMSKWVNKGFVLLDFKESKVLVTDFVAGQDPINVLCDYLKKDVENETHAFFENVQLTKDFPSKNSVGFFVYSLNDYVVISENQAACEEIIAQNKLGNTLSSNPPALEFLYAGLPARVSERIVNTKQKTSRTIYKSKILETQLTVHQSEDAQIVIANGETLTISVDAVIQDFISFDGKGNAAVLTATGELMYYINGKPAWVKNLNSKAIGPITYIEEFQLLLITCKKSIHLLDKKGSYVFGGPINLGEKTPSQIATHYKWKNKMYLVYPDQNGTLIMFNSKGVKQGSIVTNMNNIISPIDAWISQNKLFFGAHSNSLFKMIDANGKKEFRSFNLPNECQSFTKSNELFLFSTENGNLLYFDQKGNKHPLNSSLTGKLKKTTLGRNENFLITTSNQTISIFSSLGLQLGTVKTDFSDIENSDVQIINGRTFISLIDGLENNVYLYQLNGEKLLNQSFEGMKKSMLNWADGNLILTTIVDNYLIQYKVKF